MRSLVAIAMLATMGNPNLQRIDGPITTTFFDGDRLMAQCANHELSCYAYIAGVADVLATATAYGSDVVGMQACIPYGVSIGQLEQVVMEFLKVHNQEVHKAAASAVGVALTYSFPCTRS